MIAMERNLRDGRTAPHTWARGGIARRERRSRTGGHESASFLISSHTLDRVYKRLSQQKKSSLPSSRANNRGKGEKVQQQPKKLIRRKGPPLLEALGPSAESQELPGAGSRHGDSGVPARRTSTGWPYYLQRFPAVHPGEPGHVGLRPSFQQTVPVRAQKRSEPPEEVGTATCSSSGIAGHIKSPPVSSEITRPVSRSVPSTRVTANRTSLPLWMTLRRRSRFNANA